MLNHLMFQGRFRRRNEDASAGIAAGRAGGFGLVVGIGRDMQVAALLESGADQVLADLSEVSLRGDRAPPSRASTP